MIVREVREPCCPPLTPAVPNGIAIVIEIFAANAAEEAADTLDDISAARCVRFLFFLLRNSVTLQQRRVSTTDLW